jgi:hypothetical protein
MNRFETIVRQPRLEDIVERADSAFGQLPIDSEASRQVRQHVTVKINVLAAT